MIRRRPLVFGTPRRWLLRHAFRVARGWWFLSRPRHTGALVAMWCNGRVLLLRSSYRETLNLPGGGVCRHETPEAAARREMQEEIGLSLPGPLRQAGLIHTVFDHRHDTIHLFETHLATEPDLLLDGLEIIGAEWCAPASIASVPPFLRDYLCGQSADPAHTA